MKRILLLAAALAPLALAGCGPDCSGFCNKLHLCQSTLDVAQCTTSCNNVGGDHQAAISCVLDSKTDCTAIDAGKCGSLGGF